MASAPISREQWLERALPDKRPRYVASSLEMGRFRDPLYYLISPASWKPNPAQAGKFAPVSAPTGFVTDLASIPPIFFSWLRPDGEYAFAAVIHDYLYWEQSRPRKVADAIFKLAMEDLQVDRKKMIAIYDAVRAFGRSAWHWNAKLKAQGEKRVLAKFPPTAAMTWVEWKKQPGVFAPDAGYAVENT